MILSTHYYVHNVTGMAVLSWQIGVPRLLNNRSDPKLQTSMYFQRHLLLHYITYKLTVDMYLAILFMYVCAQFCCYLYIWFVYFVVRLV